MSTPTIETDRLVRVFIKIRNQRTALKQTFTDADDVLKTKLRQVENELLRRAQAEGLKGFSTADGTTYIGEEQHVSIAVPDDFNQFVLASGDLLFYEQRPSLGHIKEYQAEHDGTLPPGIKMFREFRMRVRATKSKQKEEGNDAGSDA